MRMNMKWVRTELTAILVISVLAGILLSVPSMEASPDSRVIHVNTTGWWIDPGVFNESAAPIQSAIATATDGDTIIAEETGTYNGELTVDKRLTINVNSSVVATIDASGHDTAVYINASGAVFDGFKVTNVTNGRGIVAENARDVQIINNIVELNMTYGRGIVVSNGTNAIVDRNIVNVTGEEWAGGIRVDESDTAEIRDNKLRVIGNAMGDSRAGGMNVTNSDKVLIKGNTVNISVQSEENVIARGIYIENCEKAQITGNDIKIDVKCCYANALGIHAVNSEKAQIIGNHVDINADVKDADKYDETSQGGIQVDGISVQNCYQSQIAENTVNVTGDVSFSSTVGGLSVEGSEKAKAMSEIHKSIFGSSVNQWAGGTGIDIGGCGEVEVLHNTINVSISVNPEEKGDYATGYGYLWIEGLGVSGSYAPKVYNNLINVMSDANATLSAGTSASSSAYSEAYGIAASECGDARLSGNDIRVMSRQTLNTSAMVSASEVNEGCLMARLAHHISSTKENVSAIAKSEGYTVSRSSEVWASGWSGNWAAGIYYDAAYGNLWITDNSIEVSSDTTAEVSATEEVSAEGAEAYTEGGTGAAGIAAFNYEYGNVAISGNDVSVNSAANVTLKAEETVQTAEAGSGGWHECWSGGIYAGASQVEITDNGVNVNADATISASAVEGLEDEWAGSSIGAYSNAEGIYAQYGYYGSEVSGNEVTTNSNLLIDVYAEGIGDPSAYGHGESWSEGIYAGNARIADNDVKAKANVDGATIKAKEIAAEEVGAEAYVYGTALGINTWRSAVDNNTAYAEGNANATLVAETEALLENAYGLPYTGGYGVGMWAGYSEVTRNNVEGHADVKTTTVVKGYRTGEGNFSGSWGVGIESYESSVQFNNIVGSDDIGLWTGYYWDDAQDREDASSYYVDAEYNWWGNASGPGGWGPGTGDAVIGTWEYEPWLTRPFGTVLKENKAYFGFELLPWWYIDSVSKGIEPEQTPTPPPGGGGGGGGGAPLFYFSGLRKGWNTFSTPIALESTQWSAISSIGDGLDYEIAYGFNAGTQQWVQIVDTSTLKPLDAIYIKMRSDDRVPLCISPEINNPPVKQLKKGWNLIGPAYRPIQGSLWWEYKPVNEALISIYETTTGLTGYTIVVSPPVNEWSWTYTVNQGWAPCMDTGRGYWVYMENDDELAGFSSTPLQIPFYG